MKIKIGPHTFGSKHAAKQHARAIMRRHTEIGTMLPQDELFLRDLVSIHPEAEQKIGCGIAGFATEVDPVWTAHRHFVIIRTDGSTTDFSFHTCIDGTNHRREVLSALRNAVSDQIINFKRCAFACAKEPMLCPYTGDELSPLDCHVDHTPPDTFLNLVQRWMRSYGCKSWAEIELVDNADNQWVRELKDEKLSSSWQRFHISHCNLRLVSPSANLSHVKREAAER